MNRVDQLIGDSEQCHKEVATEYFNTFSGQQERLDVVTILKRYPQLYSKETYEYVTALEPGKDVDERLARALKLVFTRNYITDRLKERSEQLANAEGEAKVEVDGAEIPFRALPVHLANEPDYDKRGRMDKAYIAQIEQLNPQREEMEEIALNLIHELGYRDLIDLVGRLQRMRVHEMRDICAGFLAQTADLYEERLATYAQRSAGIPRDKLRHGDIGYMMRARGFDELFPPADMVPALSRTLRGLGIDLENQQNVVLDLETRPKKSPRAFCISIDAPRDVRLVLLPRGGQDDYTTLFHEAGHLEFSAHMSPALSYLYRQTGDTSVHETYAFLFEHLADDPVWWREILKRDPGEFTAFSRFNRLYFIRRYSAKLSYEVEYHEGGGGQRFRDVYAMWLERGCGIPYPPQRYLADFDGGFYVLQYLQAWIWEVQLREHLRREFGEAWFTQKRAGDFLRELWHDGMKYDVWELAQKLGYPGLDIAPLLAQVTG